MIIGVIIEGMIIEGMIEGMIIEDMIEDLIEWMNIKKLDKY